MFFIEIKKIIILFFIVVALFYTDNLASSESASLNSYTDIVQFRDKFIAVGTDGRIDYISKSGEVIALDHSNTSKLNNAYANDKLIITVGDHGTINYSTDGERFHHAESGTDKNIYAITFNNGSIITGADNGVILISNNGISWNLIKTSAKGNILSLSSNGSFCIGVTEKGEILKSVDGVLWEVKDYNKEYAGYNPFSNFHKIHAAGNSIVIIGTHDDGSPSILFSSLGNVWTERLPVYYDDEGIICPLINKPNDITYDLDRNQFILACDNGILFSLPSCTKCNKYFKICEDDLNAVLCADNYLLAVGVGYSLYIERI